MNTSSTPRDHLAVVREGEGGGGFALWGEPRKGMGKEHTPESPFPSACQPRTVIALSKKKAGRELIILYLPKI